MKSFFRTLITRVVLLVSMCSVLILPKATAQFNVKIGYAIAKVSPEINNQLLATFNSQVGQQYDNYRPMEDLKFVNGVNLGARYAFGSSSLELSWENLSRARTSQGTIIPEQPAIPISTSKEFQYAFNMFMITFETRYELFGIGSSIGKSYYSMSEEAIGGGDSSFFRNDADTSQFFARFHISLNFSGRGTVAFAIKPYVQIPLSKIDLTDVASRLNVTNDDYNESFNMIGLSFNFYNGRQD